MNKPWLAQYPTGIPEHIDPTQYASLAEMFEHSVNRFANRPMYANMGSPLTFSDVDRLSREFAAYLQSSLGLNKGDRVAIMMPNVLQYPVALFGILRAGMVVVNVNPLYTARELEHQLNDAGARAIVVLENFAHVVQQVIDRVKLDRVITTQIGDLVPFPKRALVNFVVKRVRKMVPDWQLKDPVPLRRALAEGRTQPFKPPQLNHDDLAFLQYTGGTTGVSKGAMLTHGNMVANVLQASTWISPHTRVGEDTIITALPLYHIFSLTANCLTYMHLGGFNVLITNPRDIPAFVKELSKLKFTALTGVNTLFNALLQNEQFQQLDFSSFRMALGGGMAVQRAVAERWKAVTGVTLVEAYGLTESAPAATINPPDLAEYNGSIGLPLPSTELAIFDPAGQPLPAGEVGEICIRGPQVMKGYWNRPEETAKVLAPDGWLHTGDMGLMADDGFFRLVDRKKDMVVVSGFNVFPNEVEDVLAMHPDILEAGVVGIPDEKSGEVVKAVIVPKRDDLTEEEILAHCRQYLTGYKVPKVIEFRSELPKSNVGKILRRELRG
ncbi:MAG: AMP-binding protein [Pseudomonadota bacterium]|nr:AMP-binding protein [Pseudomonadota bacterium]